MEGVLAKWSKNSGNCHRAASIPAASIVLQGFSRLMFFTGISAHLLYEMFKAKSAHPLHFAVRHHREDVVFLYLIEFNLQLPGKLDEVDPESCQTPLQIALAEKQESMAQVGAC